MNLKRVSRFINSFHIIIFSFLLVILAGSILLMLPAATLDGHRTPFFEAFFTATSATCVTGLLIHNTAEYWSVFGQTVILILIQIGGIGVITVAMAIALISGKKIGLMQRSVMQEAIAAPQVGGIVKMTGFVLKGVLLIEGIGAFLLALRFCPEYGLGRGIWYAVFHSVSAFCNAGFDLMGTERGISLGQYVGDPLVNITIMLLILIGGIGFFTWQDILQYKFRFYKYRLQTKLVLVMTVILVIVPALYFFTLEFTQDTWNSLSAGEKILASFFQSVTCRTAGFSTVDPASFSEPGKLIMAVCMMIGGASGSTAGGFKVTTLAVLILAAITVFRKREESQCFGRRIAEDSIDDAVAVFMMYLGLCLLGTLVIASIEQMPLLSAFFQTIAALTTVGIAFESVSSLTIVTQIILIVLMFWGRVGGLTLIFAILSDKKSYYPQYPEEHVTVG